jgi:peptide/nickel transport system permease protein
MARYVMRRLLLAALITLCVTVMTFVLSRVVPGDPARLAAGPSASPEQVEQIRENFGLNDPIPVQYLDYMGRLVRLDFGTSILTGQSVRTEVFDRLPATLELVFVSFFVYLVLGLGLALLTASTRRPWVDGGIRGSVTVAHAIPVFILAFWLQYLLFFKLGLLPSGDRLDPDLVPPDKITGSYFIDALLAGKPGTAWDAGVHMILPVAVLVAGMIAVSVRLTRATLLNERERDYVQMLRMKGLPERRIMRRHVLRNALVPVLPMLGIQFGYLISATVIVETIFGWPGIGSYAFDALVGLDYEPVMAFVLITTVLFVLASLVIDLLYPVVDPRIRLWGDAA